MQKIVERAEIAARDNGAVVPVLQILRQLSLDDFGLVITSMPDADFPSLSQILPAMASAEIQKAWTGAAGLDLLRQTAAFARQLENNLARYGRRSLHDATILDFGCGYGRLIRMMYYYTDPARIWGVDAWERSLDICKADRLPGNFRQSERIPSSLPVDGTRFDIAYAFSIFTHLAPATAAACLGAIRGHMANDGLLVATFRPVEFWPYIDTMRSTSEAGPLIETHKSRGFAYAPHRGPEGETYGDASVTLDYFKRPGWQILGYDRMLVDPYQLSAILRAV